MVVALSGLVLPGAVGAEKASPRVVLDLELNEPRGARVASDTSGMRHNGSIGSHVTMTGSYADWDRHAPNAGVFYGAAHLITIPDAADGSLDPGSGNFTIEMRFRTTDSFGNILQKGQSATAGGQVKLQAPKGKVSCMFRTPQGTATTGSGATPLNDGRWHTIRCVRTPTSVTMYVDGVRTGRKNGSTGNLSNNKPWTIGGKLDCDAVKVTCDLFPGDIDYLTLTKG
jgi:hypothetical protein